MNIVVLGLSITSSWGNGHATTYRALLREFARRGHRVCFLERDTQWYAPHRDTTQFSFAEVHLYGSFDELRDTHAATVAEADAVILGSYVPDGVIVCDWVLATARGLRVFYDIDTPVTLGKLDRGEAVYLTPAQIPEFDLYLSFAGGPVLTRLEQDFGAQCARPLYCAVDSDEYSPQDCILEWDLGYLGTYSRDRQQGLEALMLQPASWWPEGRFAVAGAQYPADIRWPDNVLHLHHLPPHNHRAFYNAQSFSLNLTRQEMRALGYSPSVRLFEAAACGTPVITDLWEGLDTFFTPGVEILTATSTREILHHLQHTESDELRALGEAARIRVLRQHTAIHRAAELEQYLEEIAAGLRPEVLVS